MPWARMRVRGRPVLFDLLLSAPLVQACDAFCHRPETYSGREYFESHAYPRVPKLMFGVSHGAFRLHFVLQRRHGDGESWDYVELR